MDEVHIAPRYVAKIYYTKTIRDATIETLKLDNKLKVKNVAHFGRSWTVRLYKKDGLLSENYKQYLWGNE